MTLVSRPGQAEVIDTPDGQVIVSQTCDVVRSEPSLILVAPLVEKSASDSAVARKGLRPNLVHVPAAGDTWFADLARLGTLEKTYAAALPYRRGVISDEELSRFARLVGRKFSRFAFPNDVVLWLKPLETVAIEKHGRPQSAEGRLFQQVEELRVASAEPWSRPPHNLTLFVILKRGVLPMFPDDFLPDKPTNFDAQFKPNGRLLPTDRLATRLESDADPVERYWLWHSLAEAWAAKCRPRDADLRDCSDVERRRIKAAVADGEIAVELLTVDDFSMYQYTRSEMLDLDYLSPSESPFQIREIELPAPNDDGENEPKSKLGVMARLKDLVPIRLRRRGRAGN